MWFYSVKKTYMEGTTGNIYLLHTLLLPQEKERQMNGMNEEAICNSKKVAKESRRQRRVLTIIPCVCCDLYNSFFIFSGGNPQI